ncbi:MAG: PEP-CTERM sorting domain-containing protein [Sedimentisphaerales bacterium]|jgi:hypothetical protein
MFKLRKIITGLILSLALFPIQLKAVDFTWTEGHYDLPLPGYPGINILNIYNDVTVTILDNGGSFVNQFNMYDDSSLTMFKGNSIGTLNLYENSTASLFGGNIYYLWVDSTSTGLVKLYAQDVFFMPSSGPTDPGSVMGYWISNNQPFHIGFTGDSLQGEITRSFIQIVPEPATLVLVALGCLAIFRRRK